MRPKEECIVFNPGGFKVCGHHARNSFISNDCDYEKTEYLVINTPNKLTRGWWKYYESLSEEKEEEEETYEAKTYFVK